MIALLPLHGWAGGVMATKMALNKAVGTHLQAQFTLELGAASARNDWATAVFDSEKQSFAEKTPADSKSAAIAVVHDCEGHAKADSAATAGAHCDSCPACQACHTLALSPSSASVATGFSAKTRPQPVAALFASATAALGQKPPIS